MTYDILHILYHIIHLMLMPHTMTHFMNSSFLSMQPISSLSSLTHTYTIDSPHKSTLQTYPILSSYPWFQLTQTTSINSSIYLTNPPYEPILSSYPWFQLTHTTSINSSIYLTNAPYKPILSSHLSSLIQRRKLQQQWLYNCSTKAL